MFGINFPELLVCFVVALIVLGPERLPETVRTVSLWIGRIKRTFRETKEEIERQVGMDDIRRQLHTEEMMKTLENMQEEIDTALHYERMGNKSSNPQPVTLEHEQELVTESAALSKNTDRKSASVAQVASQHISVQ